MPHVAVSAGFIASLIVVGFGLLLLLLYVSSVMRFVLFDSVVAKECHIRQGWRRNRQPGLQLFVWLIFLTLTTLIGVVLLIGVPVVGAWMLGWFNHPREHVLALILGGTALLLAFVVLMLTISVIHVMTKDFIVPQMALENISAAMGWRRLWAWMKAEKIGYAGYVGMKIVLAIGTGILLAITILLVVLIVLIPVGGIGALAVMSGAASGLTWNLHTIAAAVAAGIIAFTLLLFVIAFASVPATVFFPAYAIYFFAPRYPPLAALVGLRTPVNSPVTGPPLVPPGVA